MTNSENLNLAEKLAQMRALADLGLLVPGLAALEKALRERDTGKITSKTQPPPNGQPVIRFTDLP